VNWLSQLRGGRSGLQSKIQKRRLREDWNQITLGASDLASLSSLPKAVLLTQPTLLTSTGTSRFLET